MSGSTAYGRVRIGDAERDAAAAALGEHFASGRLTRDEFDERLERAWAAKTAVDLDPLFVDLPTTRNHLAAPVGPRWGPPPGGVRERLRRGAGHRSASRCRSRWCSWSPSWSPS